MSRIEQTFARCKEEGRKALVTFITAGDPNKETSAAVLKSLPEAGADIIELGMPFADPGADGETIQLANQRALKSGANMIQTLDMVRSFRETDQTTPIVLMGYFNPLMAYGLERFTADSSAAGVDGLIIVDLPPEEDKELRTLCHGAKIDLIRLITPTSDKERLKTLLEGVSGFLYYVSITGVTGAAKADINALEPHIKEIRSLTDLPIAIGFGIKTPEDAKRMSSICDGVVVGSSIVQTIVNANGNKAASDVKELVSALKNAL